MFLNKALSTLQNIKKTDISINKKIQKLQQFSQGLPSAKPSKMIKVKTVKLESIKKPNIR